MTEKNSIEDFTCHASARAGREFSRMIFEGADLEEVRKAYPGFYKIISDELDRIMGISKPMICRMISEILLGKVSESYSERMLFVKIESLFQNDSTICISSGYIEKQVVLGLGEYFSKNAKIDFGSEHDSYFTDEINLCIRVLEVFPSYSPDTVIGPTLTSFNSSVSLKDFKERFGFEICSEIERNIVGFMSDSKSRIVAISEKMRASGCLEANVFNAEGVSIQMEEFSVRGKHFISMDFVERVIKEKLNSIFCDCELYFLGGRFKKGEKYTLSVKVLKVRT